MTTMRTPRHRRQFGSQLTLLVDGVYITATPGITPGATSLSYTLVARRHNGRPWFATVSGTGRIRLHRRQVRGAVIATLRVTLLRPFSPAVTLGHDAPVADYVAASRDVINDVLKLIARGIK